MSDRNINVIYNMIKEDVDNIKLCALTPIHEFKNKIQPANKASVIRVGKRVAYFIDNGSNVLGIAHLDFIKQGDKPSWGAGEFRGKEVLFSNTFDDRMGAYILLHILPKLDINADILLTTDEETGGSTADLFCPEKKYNWMFEFDRRGIDAVTYKYIEPKWIAAVEEAFGTVGHGSYSDICSAKLGISGVNIGTGYYSAHTDFCYVAPWDTAKQVAKFKTFYKKNKSTMFKNVIPEVKTSKYFGHSTYDDYAQCNFPDNDAEQPETRRPIPPLRVPIDYKKIGIKPPEMGTQAWIDKKLALTVEEPVDNLESEDFGEEEIPPEFKLTCGFCGSQLFSLGKHEYRYCKKCNRNLKPNEQICELINEAV